MIGKSIFLALAAGVIINAAATAQTRVVTGRVADSLTNDAITSGQVTVLGTTIGTTIKDDGTFTLAAPVRDFTLSVRSVGFKRKELPVSAATNAVEVILA